MTHDELVKLVEELVDRVEYLERAHPGVVLSGASLIDWLTTRRTACVTPASTVVGTSADHDMTSSGQDWHR